LLRRGGVSLPIDAERDFEDFYRAEYRAVVALGFVVCGSLESAEDLAQDAFLAAQRAWSRLETYDEPAAWVRRVVINRAVSLRRRWAAEAGALVRLGSQRAPKPDEHLPLGDAELWAAVCSLPRRQAQVIALVYLDDRSLAEAALVLGCGEGTVKTHLQRGRAALAKRLGVEDEEEDREPAR
jgi:RNA polymerase sigma-70 factor (ECF subfamily)